MEPLEGLVQRLVEPASARILVELAARTTSTAAGLSAPSITFERLTGFLDGVSMDSLAALLTGEPAGQPAGDEPLFSAGTSAKLWGIVLAAMPMWEFNINTGLARMRQAREEGDDATGN